MSDRVPHPVREIDAALQAVAETRVAIMEHLDALEARLQIARQHAGAAEADGRNYRTVAGTSKSLNMHRVKEPHQKPLCVASDPAEFAGRVVGALPPGGVRVVKPTFSPGAVGGGPSLPDEDDY